MWGKIASILFPKGRLQPAFPWDGKTATKKYFGSVAHFAIGGFGIPMLFIGVIFALAKWLDVYFALAYDDSATVVLGTTAVIGIGTTLSAYWLLQRWKKRARNYVNLAAYCIIGALAALNLLMYISLGLRLIYPELMSWLMSILSNKDGTPNMTFVMGLSVVSFVCGFGMQMRYIHRQLKADGLSLSDAMALNVKNVRGTVWWVKAINVIWPVAVAYGLIEVVGNSVVYVLGPAHQPTVDMARAATGGNFIAFALMAAFGAPLFEELVFRGFLFQVVRSALRQTIGELELVEEPTSGRYLTLRQFWARADNAVRRWSYPKTLGIRKLLHAYPDLIALLVSSALFSLMHLQFNPTTLVLLFLLGCIHAELYRRTGSLYCSMLLHAVNNGLEVIKLGLGG